MITFSASEVEACERSIVLAADGVAKLRQPDVMRVIEDYYTPRGTFEIVDYILERRPDLRDEAIACQLELIPLR